MNGLRVFAHRGAAGNMESDENTLKAFQNAVNSSSGVDIETDLRVSRDDVLYLAHDPVYNDHELSNLKFSDVKVIYPRVLKLSDLLDLCVKTKFVGVVNLDIKEHRAFDVIIKTGVIDGYPTIRFVISSFLHKQIVKHDAQLRTFKNVEMLGLIFDSEPLGIDTILSSTKYLIVLNYRNLLCLRLKKLVDPELRSLIQSNCNRFAFYTLNNREHIKLLQNELKSESLMIYSNFFFDHF